MISISMKDVTKSFGENNVLKGVTFDTHEGEIFGMLGPSGAGKTTIINILTKQFAADGGEVYVSASSNEMGLMLEHDGLFPRLNCLENLIIFEKIYGIPHSRSIEALESVGLAKAHKTAVEKLSRGMRQRLVIARAILHKPKILFLDEPTSALDPLTAQGIYHLIKELRGSGTTIFLTTHNMQEAVNLCDRVVMLHGGTIIEQGDPNEICDRYSAVKTIKDLEAVFVQLTGGGLQ
ncbi:MAG: ABC transporter ATP-binding protein [Defluviitaleaceae bacterium]|nr:ABC transporter ATP-binding protein [Defluviitaleaceae bacterium]